MAKRSYRDEAIAKAAMMPMRDPDTIPWEIRESRLEAIRLVYANSEQGADVEDILKEAAAVAEFLRGK